MAFPTSPTDGQVYKDYKYDSINAWIHKETLGDSFNDSLNPSIWSTFGTQYGSIVVSNGKCIITNSFGTSDNKIGIYSNKSFPVGTTIVVKSKNTSGRHASLIGFGESAWWPYPHGSGNTTDVGVTWYSRSDSVTSTMSISDENGEKFSFQPESQDLSGDQILSIERTSSSEIRFYRNEVLEHTFSGLSISGEYPIYFSADGWFNENGSGDVVIEIDWVSAF